ncbi:MAG: DUF2236 domain-containing protein [Acidobacteriota bacterium]|nr:DUF2236 domain-containing protein [Acidobacteriota bacterium]
MRDFVEKNSIVRRIWSNPDLILLVFAGSAAEFALNRAVDWLFFTGRIPEDPIGRFFSTVSYAQQIIFADESEAAEAVRRINAIHAGVERARGQKIPDWAYRDVLYMLIDYSQRSFELLFRPLSGGERAELFNHFRRVGEMMEIEKLPEDYAAWRKDRQLHLERDLDYTPHTRSLFEQYRKHVGEWRYRLLLDVQALIVPHRVRRLLRLSANNPLSYLIWSYGIVDGLGLQSLARRALLPPAHREAVERLSRPDAAK